MSAFSCGEISMPCWRAAASRSLPNSALDKVPLPSASITLKASLNLSSDSLAADILISCFDFVKLRNMCVQSNGTDDSESLPAATSEVCLVAWRSLVTGVWMGTPMYSRVWLLHTWFEFSTSSLPLSKNDVCEKDCGDQIGLFIA